MDSKVYSLLKPPPGPSYNISGFPGLDWDISWGGGFESQKWVIDYGGLDIGKLEQNHIHFILNHFKIPLGILPTEVVKKTPPEKLRQLGNSISEYGGEEKIRLLFDHLSDKNVKITGYLGGGGWGQVFRIALPQSNTPAAMKVLKPPYLKKWSDRFLGEVRILRKFLNHKGVLNIVKDIEEVYGLKFFFMELIDGFPLSDVTVPIQPRLAFNFTKEILQILSDVHAEGVVHRNLHLGNIVISPERLVILDFGLARDELKANEYKTFRPVGAMSHCAPEKWIEPESAGPASDVFSVGVMFYRLLTGKHPFWANT